MSRTVWVILAVLALAFAAVTGLAVRARRPRRAPRPDAPRSAARSSWSTRTAAAVDQRVLEGQVERGLLRLHLLPGRLPDHAAGAGQAEKLLGPKADDFQMVFITVDPGRDTPAS